METKYIALIAGIMLAAGYGIGRYAQPPRVETKIQIQKEVEVHEIVHTVTKTVEHPDGSKETIVDEDKEKNTQSDTTKSKDTQVVTSRSSNFSFIAGIEPTSIKDINIGASWQTQPVSILPVTVGIWGLVSPTPTIGISLGWNY